MVAIPLYNTICENYNSSRRADKYISERIISLLNLNKGYKYIDVGCGTGNYTIALSNYGGIFIGVDPSKKMLDIAAQSNSSIKWTIGSAEIIPFEDEYFEGGVATLTIHHWENIEKSFQEISRVLKVNSRFVIFTSLPKQMKGYWLNHYFPEMMADSFKKMPSIDKIEFAAHGAGFNLMSIENYEIQPDLDDKFLYSGKMSPAMYLDNSFRSGISSFANHKHTKEIETGLKRLDFDLDSNRFTDIKVKFQNSEGDYCFIVFTKMS
jgi:ubiquinone/menaquinone biosynthesis C-methylase UbiE